MQSGAKVTRRYRQHVNGTLLTSLTSVRFRKVQSLFLLKWYKTSFRSACTYDLTETTELRMYRSAVAQRRGSSDFCVTLFKIKCIQHTAMEIQPISVFKSLNLTLVAVWRKVYIKSAVYCFNVAASTTVITDVKSLRIMNVCNGMAKGLSRSCASPTCDMKKNALR